MTEEDEHIHREFQTLGPATEKGSFTKNMYVYISGHLCSTLQEPQEGAKHSYRTDLNRCNIRNFENASWTACVAVLRAVHGRLFHYDSPTHEKARCIHIEVRRHGTIKSPQAAEHKDRRPDWLETGTQQLPDTLWGRIDHWYSSHEDVILPSPLHQKNSHYLSENSVVIKIRGKQKFKQLASSVTTSYSVGFMAPLTFGQRTQLGLTLSTHVLHIQLPLGIFTIP